MARLETSESSSGFDGATVRKTPGSFPSSAASGQKLPLSDVRFQATTSPATMRAVLQPPLEPPESVREFFLAAGWPIARPSADQSIPEGHPAAVVLEAFGGLRVGGCGHGEECASSDIEFGHSDYQSNSIILEWQRLLSTRLVNIGEVHHSHGALFVDDSGAWYGMSFIHDAFWFEGASFAEAVERILLGRRSRAMLRPDQTSVSMYGVEISGGHPDAYEWRGGASRAKV